MIHLPSRPQPDSIEALHSYGSRIAGANGITLTELLGYQPTPTAWRTGDPALLEAMAEVTGESVEFLANMTYAAYDVRPGGMLVGFAGLRRFHERVVCHACYRRTGVRLRQWEHALIVICQDCERLLEPLGEPHPQMARPQVRTRMDLRLVVDALADSPTLFEASTKFHLMRRAAAPILRGISPTWPRLPDPVLKQWHARAVAELRRYPAKRNAGRPASPYVATAALMVAWRKLDLDRDYALVRRLERRFPPAPTTKQQQTGRRR